MKQLTFAFIIALTVIAISPTQAQKILKQVITLQMPEGDGKNSAAVAWHPITKKYYSSMAGNAIYPMGVFDEKGKILQDDMQADYDFRGIWYNPITKLLQFNTYDSSGVGHIELENDGKIKSKMIDFEGMYQPDRQSVGTFYTPGNNVMYFSPSHYVEKYDSKTFKALGSLTYLYVGCKTKKESDALTETESTTKWDDRNLSVQYTNIPKAELAVLNVIDRTIELYDKRTGFLTQIAFSIPESITLELNFNFSYANGIWWFFQKENRQWVGCK
jgi:hypothetical protein